MFGPFATASRRYIAIHQVSLLSHYSAGGVRCPRQRQQRQQRQRVTEGTAMALWNGPNYFTLSLITTCYPPAYLSRHIQIPSDATACNPAAGKQVACPYSLVSCLLLYHPLYGRIIIKHCCYPSVCQSVPCP